MAVFHHLKSQTFQIVNILKLEWRIRVEAAPMLSNVADVLLRKGLSHRVGRDVLKVLSISMPIPLSILRSLEKALFSNSDGSPQIRMWPHFSSSKQRC